MTQVPVYDLIKEDAIFVSHFYSTLSPTSLRSTISTAVLQSCLQEEPTTPAFYVIDAFFIKLANVLDGVVLTRAANQPTVDMIAQLKAKVANCIFMDGVLKTMSTRSIKDLQGLDGIERVVIEAVSANFTYNSEDVGDVQLTYNPIYLMHAGTSAQYEAWECLMGVAAVATRNPTPFTSNFKELLRVCTQQ